MSAKSMITSGRRYTYVLPCAWEDHCKVGFSCEPLARIASLHPRWYDVSDLDRVVLIEVDTVKEARHLELQLCRPLAEHREPPTSTMRIEAGGVTGWPRGVLAPLALTLEELRTEGHCIHTGRPWLTLAFSARTDIMMESALAQFCHYAQTDLLIAIAPQYVRDELDTLEVFGINPATMFSSDFMNWYIGGNPWCFMHSQRGASARG